MFVGRIDELQELKRLKSKKTASLIVLYGRRRIGKSSLIAQFGKSFANYFEFQGLGPREHQTNQQQMDSFAAQLKTSFELPGFKFGDWSEAFTTLATLTKNKECLILLDEISWMAYHDRDFAGKLKIAWDTQFKKNPKLILAICGSVSSWIEKNILHDVDFVGRVSWAKNLAPMKMADCNAFWGKNAQRISNQEKLTLLAVTGCIPKYLEEMVITDSAQENIGRLCFTNTGYLYLDFEKIFNDVFNRRASIYKKIVRHLISEKHDARSLSSLLDVAQGGDLTDYLDDMRKAGFVGRDYTWDFSGKMTKLSRYRIRDNYLRFYLKYVEPRKDQIEKGVFQFSSLDALLGWDTIVGLQFENLILDNIHDVLDLLGIDAGHVCQYGPFFQTKTQKRAGCQVDLLILDRFQTLYLCEIKIGKRIGCEVIHEVAQKIERLERPKNFSIRPVLLYSGQLTPPLVDQLFFDKMIDIGELV